VADQRETNEIGRWAAGILFLLAVILFAYWRYSASLAQDAELVFNEAAEVAAPASAPQQVMQLLNRPAPYPLQTASGATPQPGSAPAKELLPYDTYGLVSGAGGKTLLFSRPLKAATTLYAWSSGARPVRVYGEARWSPLGLAVHGGRAYFIAMPSILDEHGKVMDDTPPYKLLSSKLSGGRAEPVEAADVYAGNTHLAFSGRWRYLSYGGGPVVNGTPSKITVTNMKTGVERTVRGPAARTVTAMLVHGAYLYWCSADQPRRPLDHQPGRLWRVRLDAGGGLAGEAPEQLITSSDRPTLLAALDKELYVMRGGTPARGFRDGSLGRWDQAARTTRVGVKGINQGDHLVPAAGHLCWGEQDMKGTWITCYEPGTDRLVQVTRVGETVSLHGPAALEGMVVWSQDDHKNEENNRTYGLRLEQRGGINRRRAAP